MMPWRKRRNKPEIEPPTVPIKGLPPKGWHDGTLATFHVLRRQDTKEYPGGWDLVDTHTNGLIGEYTERELTDMFKAVYQLCYDNTFAAMRLLGSATPEHEDSPDGEPIAVFRFDMFTTLPKTIKMTKKQAQRTERIIINEPF